MAIPSDFRDSTKVIGDSAIKHPIYVFSISLNRPTSEAIGPITNQKSVNLLHPDMYTSSPSTGRTQMAQHQTGNSSWIPGFLRGPNVIINGNGTITAYGSHAVYLKKTFADVANPMLTLINYHPYTSTSTDDPVETFSFRFLGGASIGGAATESFVDN